MEQKETLQIKATKVMVKMYDALAETVHTHYKDKMTLDEAKRFTRQACDEISFYTFHRVDFEAVSNTLKPQYLVDLVIDLVGELWFFSDKERLVGVASETLGDHSISFTSTDKKTFEREKREAFKSIILRALAHTDLLYRGVR